MNNPFSRRKDNSLVERVSAALQDKPQGIFVFDDANYAAKAIAVEDLINYHFPRVHPTFVRSLRDMSLRAYQEGEGVAVRLASIPLGQVSHVIERRMELAIEAHPEVKAYFGEMGRYVSDVASLYATDSFPRLYRKIKKLLD